MRLGSVTTRRSPVTAILSTGGSTVAEQRARYRDVFRVGEFRSLFAAHLLSVVGDQFARVALTVLVFSRTGSATLTALTYALTFLPDLVGGPLLSGLADRYKRRQVMIVTDLARAGLVAVMAVPGVPFVALCGLLAGVQLLAAPFNAARAATLPVVFSSGEAGPDDRYVLASAVSNMSYQLAQLVGFAVGGVLVAVNPSVALLLDAATFLVSAAVIYVGVQARPVPAVTGDRPASWGHRVRSGAELVWRDRLLRLLLLMLCVSAFPLVAEALAVPYAADLGAGPVAVGLLLATGPAGAVVGMLLNNRLAPPWRVRLMPWLTVAACAVLLPCALEPGLASTMVLWTLSGLAMAYFITANAEFVRRIPDEQRGQVFGLAATALRVSQGLVVLCAGAVADLMSPAAVVAIAGGLGTVVATVALVQWRRRPVQSMRAGGAPLQG